MLSVFILNIIRLIDIMLNAVYAELQYAECLMLNAIYTEWHYAECLYSEYH